MNKLSLNEKYNEFEKSKEKINQKKISSKNKNIGNINEELRFTFNEEIQIIKNGLVKNISECNAKKEKDIIIIVDFNIYKKRDNNEINIHIIDAFLTEIKIILK